MEVKLRAKLDDACRRIALLAKEAGGRALMVGGAVRDACMGIEPKDVDIEVFAIDADKLRNILAKEHFHVIEVGASFGVFKIRGYDLDVALPRRERKSGTGHRGFAIESDPDMGIEEAALRRDFTINALYYDILTEEIIDPLGGLKDLKENTLRHCGPRFVEDPLRVLRAMQFVARFNLKVAPETLEICRSMTMENLPKERVFEEWRKLILKGASPRKGMQFLRDSGWVDYFPELKALIGCRQWEEWHPEGDAWNHTLHCLDAFTKLRTGDEREDLIVGLAVLCHDLGKPATTFVDAEGRIRAFGHDTAGEAPTRDFLARMTEEKHLIEDVASLVKTHMQPAGLYKGKAGMNAVRRLATKVRIDRLVLVARADMRGTPPRTHDETPCDWLMEKAEKIGLEKEAPRPIILGRHLIKLGLKPGPRFKEFLNALFEAQLEGAFSDVQEGLKVAQKMIDESTGNNCGE